METFMSGLIGKNASGMKDGYSRICVVLTGNEYKWGAGRGLIRKLGPVGKSPSCPKSNPSSKVILISPHRKTGISLSKLLWNYTRNSWTPS